MRSNSPLWTLVAALRHQEVSSFCVRAQWQVSKAFDTFMADLHDVFEGFKEHAPNSKEEGYFASVLDYWHAECGLTDGLHSDLHLLRIGRNGHVHTDEEKWARFRQRLRVRTDDDAVALLESIGSAIQALRGFERRLPAQ